MESLDCRRARGDKTQETSGQELMTAPGAARWDSDKAVVAAKEKIREIFSS